MAELSMQVKLQSSVLAKAIAPQELRQHYGIGASSFKY